MDEAHLLSREMLEEIRFLLNLRMDSYSALSLILVGQPELSEILRLHISHHFIEKFASIIGMKTYNQDRKLT